MSGFGWNSGFGNFNGGLNHALPSHPNPNNFQENCVLCNQIFYRVETLISHYEAHLQDDEVQFHVVSGGNHNLPLNLFQPQPSTFNPVNASATLFQINYLQIQNQTRVSQRNLVLGPNPRPFFTPPILPIQAPLISRNPHNVIQQQQQWQLQQHQLAPLPPPPPQQQEQEQLRPQANQRVNFVPPNNDMRLRAAATQPSQPIAARPDEMEIDFGDDDNSSQDGSINLDLTLGL